MKTFYLEPLKANYYWELRPNIWPKIPYDLSLWKRATCQTLSKTLDMSSATARVAPRPVKGPTNSIRYNCRKIYSWSRRPKTTLEIRKKDHISRGGQQSYYLQVFENLPKKDWKTRFLKTLIKEFSYYVRKLRLTVF